MKNDALRALKPYIGDWDYTMYNCWFLESMDSTAGGMMTVERLDDAFVVFRDTAADKKPSSTWIIGYSDPQHKYEMFYSDERGTARIFQAAFDGQELSLHREDGDMYQRMKLQITEDGLHAVAEASDDEGKSWRKDFEMKYTRRHTS